jgi:hypothetical protein
VTVTQGNFKNYRGRIKSTMGDGRVLVELDARLQRPEPFNLSSLHLKYAFVYVIKKQFAEHIPSVDAGLLPARPRNLLTDFSNPLPLAPVTSSSSIKAPPSRTNLTSTRITPLPIPYPHMLYPAPPPEVPATPLPSLQDIPASPTWNPSSRTPHPGDDGENIHTIK